MLFMAMTHIARQSQACQRHVKAIGLLAIPIIALCLAAVRLEWIDPALLGLGSARQQRFSGSIGNPNVAGVIFAMIALLAMGATITHFRNWLARPTDRSLLTLAFTGATCGFCLTLVVDAITRAVLLCCLASPYFGLFDMARRTYRHYRLAGAALLVLMSLPAVPAFDRLQGLAEDGAGRLAVWERFWLIAKAAPWAGYGLGSFIEVNQRQLTTDSALTMWDFGAAHAAPCNW
jgi:O-antigen ligase